MKISRIRVILVLLNSRNQRCALNSHPEASISEQPETTTEKQVIVVTPVPQPSVESTPEPTKETQEMAAVVEPTPETTPKELPKTASPMGLIGLIGFLSATGGYVARFFRR